MGRSPTSSAWSSSLPGSLRSRSPSPKAATGAGRAHESSVCSSSRSCSGSSAVRRSARHHAPAIDLELFRSRTVVLANAATLLYAIGFFGMLLGNVLFLTSVWHYSTLEAGLAITPAPLVVAALSGPSGKLAARFGYAPGARRRRAAARGRAALLRRGPRSRSALPHPVAARLAARRRRHRALVPGAQRRVGCRAARRSASASVAR